MFVKSQETIIGIFFEFTEYNKCEIEVHLEDKNQSGFRPLLDNFMKQKGDKIKPKVGHWVENIVEFDQEIYTEEDTNRNCANYPKGGYKECDKNSIRKSLDDLGLKNMTPIWATDNMDEVTKHLVLEISAETTELISQIFSGIQKPNCQDPCISTATYTKLINSNKQADNSTWLQILIPEYIQIKKTEMVQFNCLTTLMFLGANMGLWLGMGVVQFMEVFVNFLVLKLRVYNILNSMKSQS